MYVKNECQEKANKRTTTNVLVDKRNLSTPKDLSDCLLLLWFMTLCLSRVKNQIFDSSSTSEMAKDFVKKLISSPLTRGSHLSSKEGASLQVLHGDGIAHCGEKTKIR